MCSLHSTVGYGTARYGRDNQREKRREEGIWMGWECCCCSSRLRGKWRREGAVCVQQTTNVPPPPPGPFGWNGQSKEGGDETLSTVYSFKVHRTRLAGELVACLLHLSILIPNIILRREQQGLGAGRDRRQGKGFHTDLYAIISVWMTKKEEERGPSGMCLCSLSLLTTSFSFPF